MFTLYFNTPKGRRFRRLLQEHISTSDKLDSQGILILISLKFQLISSFYVIVCCTAAHCFRCVLYCVIYPTWSLFHRKLTRHHGKPKRALNCKSEDSQLCHKLVTLFQISYCLSPTSCFIHREVGVGGLFQLYFFYFASVSIKFNFFCKNLNKYQKYICF